IGITGGIASGKSVASNILKEKHNAYVFDADKEAKKLLSTPEISRAVFDAFPDLGNVITAKSLAKVVFLNEENQKKINQITHPVVNKETLKRIEKIRDENQHPLFVVDAPLIIESGSYQYYNESNSPLILITSPESVRIERALARGYLALKTIQDRIKLQWPDEKKREYADYIIENNSSLAKFESEIEKLIQKIINDTKS
ncbi:MAG: dephospho-CoA kinase, partial [Candidatus Neomarinimicrobiota bacterium]|nr:dephospho-CoA kinase [Candidatus Neomarinimicrobiota bacterium]